jgi:hypothetical protein
MNIPPYYWKCGRIDPHGPNNTIFLIPKIYTLAKAIQIENFDLETKGLNRSPRKADRSNTHILDSPGELFESSLGLMAGAISPINASYGKLNCTSIASNKQLCASKSRQ